MEMDTTLLDNHIKGIEDESAEQLHATCSFMDEIFGDPQVIPRVGDQYQAEIPPLVGQHRSLQVVKEPTDSKVIMNVPNPFPMGLPIPLFWTKTEVESINGALEFENNEESRITSSHGCAEYKVESLDSVLGDGKNMRGYSKLQPTTKTKKDIDLLFPKEPKSKMNQVHRVPCPLPGSLSEVWKAIELDIFLLGLYIFGKNLILVKNFVESKGMGEILSFYYGKFYRSDGYCRWSECRKSRGRRCILGQKLFTGWRQQQLLSQLFSHISKEDQDMLLEVSKTFGEGKVSFEEYVFTIKNTVGIGLLIEAIGIGKGKQDHTGNAMEPVKVNHVVSFRPEIPVGKACSALTSADIIKFLTGDFRLSKARSSDLFWEAVWPRLLARGWHSEQPKDQVLSGSKNSLVFLIPGVKKFSKRRLVKDTSLVQGAERSKVRELRSLPLEATSLSTPSSISSDSEEDTSDDSEDEAEENSASHAAEAMADEGECVDLSDCVNSNSNTVIPHTSDTSIISVENHESHHASLLDDEGQKVVKYNFVQNVHSSDSKYLAPVSKEQGLTDCTNGESSCSVENISAARMLNEDTSHCRSNSSDACEDMVFQTGSQDLSPASSLSKVHRDEGKEGNVTQNCLHRQESPIMTRLHTLIDLNVPQVSMDFETNGPFVTETVKNSENSCAHISFFQSEIPPRPEPLKLPNKGAEVNQHPIMHNRRQSTRNRPLTTKALEALECGFFSPKRKRKAAEALQNNSQRVRGRPVVSSIFRNGASNPNMEEN
ncbi:uncharacterized protein LOC111283901 isoform X2 [Durio zibethinus]|uniref:Uncharacterized protein LOC111283901 isoform X2 n=1 Tax=Durio zibethinus TaxID=66656 RepID=A0A6P5XKE5_DURZI|nr:uncharacterized protein LOC111283901 isoform X2 [Durio zibethinus]